MGGRPSRERWSVASSTTVRSRTPAEGTKVLSPSRLDSEKPDGVPKLRVVAHRRARRPPAATRETPFSRYRTKCGAVHAVRGCVAVMLGSHGSVRAMRGSVERKEEKTIRFFCSPPCDSREVERNRGE